MSVGVGMGVIFRSDFELDAGEERQRGGRTESSICLKSYYYASLALI